MVEEVALFIRSAIYGIAVGAIYWFLTYEDAGSILLVGMGLATVVVALVLWFGLDRRWRSLRPNEDAPDRPFEDEAGRIPEPTVAPLVLAFGTALTVLGLVFTPALVITGLILSLIAAREWLRSAVVESAAESAAESAMEGRHAEN
jgi:Cytochrome c oxidase subunit IV